MRNDLITWHHTGQLSVPTPTLALMSDTVDGCKAFASISDNDRGHEPQETRQESLLRTRSGLGGEDSHADGLGELSDADNMGSQHERPRIDITGYGYHYGYQVCIPTVVKSG